MALRSVTPSANAVRSIDPSRLIATGIFEPSTFSKSSAGPFFLTVRSAHSVISRIGDTRSLMRSNSPRFSRPLRNSRRLSNAIGLPSDERPKKKSAFRSNGTRLYDEPEAPSSMKSAAPNQALKDALNLAMIDNHRRHRGIGRLQPDFPIFAIETLQRGLAAVIKRHHDFAIIGRVASFNHDEIAVQDVVVHH